MEMTSTEIYTYYKDAKNKKEQIRIIAQLNDCKIRDVLLILGIPPKETRLNAGMLLETRNETFMRLYSQGMTDKQIASETRYSRIWVKKWRLSRKLKSNYGKGE